MKLLRQWYDSLTGFPPLRFVINLLNRFGENNGAFFAAGLSFFLLLSFVPIALSGVAIVGSLFDFHTASAKVTEAVESALPAGGARDEAARFLTSRLHLDDQVRAVIKQRGAAAVFGILSLFLASIQIFINASVAMNVTWGVRETRNWFLLRGEALLLMIFTGLICTLSLFLSGSPLAIENYHLPIVKDLPMSITLLSVVFEIIALFINAIMYTMLYKLLPNAKVQWRSAVIGGISASFLFEVAKKLVASYLLRANHTIYGDLANLILFILWIYYSMTILLLGSEIAASCQQKETA